MCEVGKRRWQEEGTHPVTTSETTANSDRALINSSRTHFHIHNEGSLYTEAIEHRRIYPLSVTLMTFSIYKPLSGLLANGKKRFSLKINTVRIFVFVGGTTEIRPLGDILGIKSYDIQSHLVLQMSASDQRQQKMLHAQWQENKDISESAAHNMTANQKEESCQ